MLVSWVDRAQILYAMPSKGLKSKGNEVLPGAWPWDEDDTGARRLQHLENKYERGMGRLFEPQWT